MHWEVIVPRERYGAVVGTKSEIFFRGLQFEQFLV